MTNERRVLVHPDKESLAGSAAARFITKMIDVLETQPEAHIALTGGTMGIAVLAAINTSPARDTLDWSRLHFWWGDERWVPRGHADRNDQQAYDALLSHVPLDESKVHTFGSPDEYEDLDAAAAAYAAELKEAASDGDYPQMAVTFLGVGPDGHIASLFPGLAGIRETQASVIAVRNSPKPPPERLSLTLPVINASERIWLVLAGADKASALALTMAGANAADVPAAGVQGRKRTVFFVDREATAEVPEDLVAANRYWTAADE